MDPSPQLSRSRFTERLKLVLHLAEQVAALGNGTVGAEHLLAGILDEAQGPAVAVLEGAGIDLPVLRMSALAAFTAPPIDSDGPPFVYSHAAAIVLEYAVDEADHLVHSHIGTEHLLLGIIRHGDNGGARVLKAAGLTLSDARLRLQRLFSSPHQV